MSDVEFSMSASCDRRLFWEAGLSVRYLVARINARRLDGERSAPRAPLNIALAIDVSGSMAGERLEAAKKAAVGLAAQLTEQDCLSIVSFGSDSMVHLDAVSVHPGTLPMIRQTIEALETSGMTNLSDGWFTAVDCAARIAERDPRMTARVILLSDGHANRGITEASELGEHAHQLRLRGVLTSALGIGNDYDEHLLRGIAESGGGRLHDAEVATEISTVLLGELQDISLTCIDNAEIILSTSTKLRIEAVGRGRIEERDGDLVLSLGAIQSESERVAVFKVICPKLPAGKQVHFTVTARGNSMSEAGVIGAGPVQLALTAAEGDRNSAQGRDDEVAEIVAKAWSAHVVTMVAKMNARGAFPEAQGFIRKELLHFANYVHGLRCGPALVRELDLLAHRAGSQISPRMRKEMVLQSSLAMEGRVDRRSMSRQSWSARMRDGNS